MTLQARPASLGLLLVTFAGCSGSGSDGGESNVGTTPRSLAVLGDSIASGEGINYGLSVLLRNKSSLAPFHPTPEGQQRIAAIIEQALRGN